MDKVKLVNDLALLSNDNLATLLINAIALLARRSGVTERHVLILIELDDRSEG